MLCKDKNRLRAKPIRYDLRCWLLARENKHFQNFISGCVVGVVFIRCGADVPVRTLICFDKIFFLFLRCRRRFLQLFFENHQCVKISNERYTKKPKQQHFMEFVQREKNYEMSFFAVDSIQQQTKSSQNASGCCGQQCSSVRLLGRAEQSQCALLAESISWAAQCSL